MHNLWILAAIAALAVLTHFYNRWAYRDKDDRGPEMTAHVTVHSKRVSQGRYLGAAPSRWNFLVSFTFSDREEIELYVTQAQFSKLQENQTGQLTWQGKRFHRFDPDVSQ